ncbi:MAG: N-6 DNA methylase [Paludibacteraceae bacterium]|nr:N-6 DNA methylase [Paludibacteraceae bacterium]
MATIFSAEELRTMFQSSFSMQTWYNCLQNLFNASELKVTPEKINNSTLENGYYLGNIDTVDRYRIGLFYYKITQGSVAKRKIGLRNFVRSFINPTWGEFDAALVVFDSGDLWRLSFICDIKGEATSPKRYTYVFGNHGILYRTPIERFRFLQNKGVSFENLKTAFSVEALSDEFFNRYREQYADFIQYITGKRFIKVGGKWEEKVLGLPNDSLMLAFEFNEKKIRDYIKKMMGRLTLLHFLQRKGWLCGDLNYLQNLFVRSQYQDDYLDNVLEPLFFGILNTKPEGRKQIFEQYNWDLALLKEWESIPYLNGGLFERDKEDEPESKFPADYFKRLFQFFSEYNFTIDENDPNDAEVGVDPEMLGKIFENLLEDNKDKGAFYTPKEIVRYMCQESLIAYLETNTSIAKEKIRQFVLVPDENVEEIPENKRSKLLEALKDVKICDPAIGSGAFPMGLLNELLNCREALEHLDVPRSEIKKSIIQNNIYGVDIEKGAVDIARLRFWLSIVVDEEKASPLPNLDYKIMQGNSLIESYKGLDLSKLTYEKEGKKDSGEVELFDDEKKQMQKRLSILLSKYYSCSDHDEKERIKQEIFETIYLQLKQLAYSDAILSELKNINFAENNQFFLWHTWFSDVFNRPNGKSGFDIVIGNPPYVNIANIKDETLRKTYQQNYKTIKNKSDLYSIFTERAHWLLGEKGICSFIFSNSWMGTDSFSLFRKFLVNETKIIKLIDLPDRVFETAQVKTCIILFAKEKIENTTIVLCNYDGLQFSTLNHVLTYNNIRKYENYPFSFERGIDLTKIKTVTLGQIAKFSLGIKTSNDKKFISHEPFLEDNYKLIRGRNIQRYSYPISNEWIWYRPDLFMEKAGSGARKLEYFLTDTKIVIQDIGTEICATIDRNKFLCNDTINLIYQVDKDYSFEYVLGLLNSKTIRFWHKKVFPEGLHIKKYQLMAIPIAEVACDVQFSIARLVSEVLDNKVLNPRADTTELEKQIDKLIYRIYNLTEEEIKIIEENM